MSELVPVTEKKSMSISVFEMTPSDKIHHFTEMANILKDIIRRQKMFSTIQGKEHVKVEGWITLGTLIGILPREKTVTELNDGSFIAEVELVNFTTGTVVGGASALCSVEETRWARADKYARRSMAVTRATGKAYRISFAWVMSMAGYETTPAEEMPIEEIYTGTNDQEKALASYLEKKGVDPALYEKIGKALEGRPKRLINDVIEQVVKQ